MSELTDDEFLSRFVAATLPPGQFGHRSHLRAAWLCVRLYGVDQGGEYFVRSLKHYVAVHDSRAKYHETLTRTWLVAVVDALIGAEDVTDFDRFLELRPRLLDPRHPEHHYSPDLLWSDAARRDLVEPDRLPLIPGLSR
jgi:hypothetical protein